MLVFELPVRGERDLCERVGLMGRGDNDLLRQRSSCGPARSLHGVSPRVQLLEAVKDPQILPPNSHSGGIFRRAPSPTCPS